MSHSSADTYPSKWKPVAREQLSPLSSESASSTSGSSVMAGLAGHLVSKEDAVAIPMVINQQQADSPYQAALQKSLQSRKRRLNDSPPSQYSIPKHYKDDSIHQTTGLSKQEVVAKVEQAMGKVYQLMQSGRYDEVEREEQKLGESVGRYWRYPRDWVYRDYFTRDQQLKLRVLYERVEASKWITEHPAPPDNWCQSIRHTIVGRGFQYYCQALSFVRAFVAAPEFHPPGQGKQRLHNALDGLEKILRGRKLHGPSRPVWLDTYMEVCASLEHYPDGLDHPLARLWPTIKQVKTAIEKHLAHQPRKKCPHAALHYLHLVLEKVRDDGFKSDDLIILGCIIRYISREYILQREKPGECTVTPRGKGKEGEKPLAERLSNAYFFPVTLLLFGCENANLPEAGGTLANLGRLRIPIDQIAPVLGDLATYFNNTPGLKGWSKQCEILVRECCLLLDHKYLDALEHIADGNYQQAHKLLEDLRECVETGDERNVIYLAKAWCYLKQGRRRKVEEYLDKVNADDDSNAGFQRLLLEVRLNPENHKLLDISSSGLTEFHHHFFSRDLDWLFDHQRGKQHDYPSVPALSQAHSRQPSPVTTASAEPVRDKAANNKVGNDQLETLEPVEDMEVTQSPANTSAAPPVPMKTTATQTHKPYTPAPAMESRGMQTEVDIFLEPATDTAPADAPQLAQTQETDSELLEAYFKEAREMEETVQQQGQKQKRLEKKLEQANALLKKALQKNKKYAANEGVTQETVEKYQATLRKSDESRRRLREDIARLKEEVACLEEEIVRHKEEATRLKETNSQTEQTVHQLQQLNSQQAQEIESLRKAAEGPDQSEHQRLLEEQAQRLRTQAQEIEKLQVSVISYFRQIQSSDKNYLQLENAFILCQKERDEMWERAEQLQARLDAMNS